MMGRNSYSYDGTVRTGTDWTGTALVENVRES